MSSRLDRITLSLSSPTFFAFTFPLLPSFNCQMRRATSVLPARVNVGLSSELPFPSRCNNDLITGELAFPME